EDRKLVVSVDGSVVVASHVGHKGVLGHHELLHAGLPFSGRHARFFGDLLRGGQVLFHQQRRDGEHVAVVVETVAGVVAGELIGGVNVDAEQVTYGVV